MKKTNKNSTPLACPINAGGKHNETNKASCQGAFPSGKNCNEDFFRDVSIEFLVHELKSPVSIIESGASRLLSKQEPAAPSSPQQLRTLTRILRNAQKTREILDQLLEVGRATDACFQCRPFSPWQTVRNITLEMVELTAPELIDQMGELSNSDAKLAFLAQHGIRLERSANIETLIIEQDEIKFSQIVGNLIKNGLYYRRRYLLIHATHRKEALSVSVRDDGPGIATIHHETIFQRYKQVAPCEGVARHGHGLGLAAARILARSMGGDIHVESELGQGALFNLSLPFILTPRRQRLTKDSDI